MKFLTTVKNKIANGWDDLTIWWAELSPAKREIWRWASACAVCWSIGVYVGATFFS